MEIISLVHKISEVSVLLKKAEIVGSGEVERSFSQVNGKPKYSDGASVCTIFTVSGINKDTKKRVSFMVHQFPGYVSKLTSPKTLYDLSDFERYSQLLTSRLDELLPQIEPNFLKIDIAGAIDDPNMPEATKLSIDAQEIAIERILMKVKQHFPEISTENCVFRAKIPNRQGEGTSMLHDTESDTVFVGQERNDLIKADPIPYRKRS